MELGEKLKLARQEAGLSQRQLCGDVITRNMLSQIEHGTARPSMDTLRYLAERLGKPVSWFLEEDVVVSRNQERMVTARQAAQGGNWQEVWELLEDFQEPDPVFEGERRYLMVSAALSMAETALKESREILAREWLEKAELIKTNVPGMERRRLLMMGRIPGTDLNAVVGKLPSLDEELLLRAEAALMAENWHRAEKLLEAAEDRNAPRWNLLMGRFLSQEKQFSKAAVCLEQAEAAYPNICHPLLEECFRELGDFQKAYLYACKQR